MLVPLAQLAAPIAVDFEAPLCILVCATLQCSAKARRRLVALTKLLYWSWLLAKDDHKLAGPATSGRETHGRCTMASARARFFTAQVECCSIGRGYNVQRRKHIEDKLDSCLRRCRLIHDNAAAGSSYRTGQLPNRCNAGSRISYQGERAAEQLTGRLVSQHGGDSRKKSSGFASASVDAFEAENSGSATKGSTARGTRQRAAKRGVQSSAREEYKTRMTAALDAELVRGQSEAATCLIRCGFIGTGWPLMFSLLAYPTLGGCKKHKAKIACAPIYIEPVPSGGEWQPADGIAVR